MPYLWMASNVAYSMFQVHLDFNGFGSEFCSELTALTMSSNTTHAIARTLSQLDGHCCFQACMMRTHVLEWARLIGKIVLLFVVELSYLCLNSRLSLAHRTCLTDAVPLPGHTASVYVARTIRVLYEPPPTCSIFVYLYLPAHKVQDTQRQLLYTSVPTLHRPPHIPSPSIHTLLPPHPTTQRRSDTFDHTIRCRHQHGTYQTGSSRIHGRASCRQRPSREKAVAGMQRASCMVGEGN